MKRPLLIAITAGIMLVATSCGSDPAPSPTVGSGSEVDRSSAEATAVAFANIYATGDVPAACELASDVGKQTLGTACQRKQEWSTTVILTGDCEKAVGAAGRTFFFDAPEGSLNRNSRLEVDVAPGANSMWFVTAAVTPADGGGSSPCAPSSAASSSSAADSTGGG